MEYFGQKLKGFCFTEAGWVQSYGSRYVRPPIIYADVSRPAAMTVKEFKVAQSLTQKPVKGMLTGGRPVMIWAHCSCLCDALATVAAWLTEGPGQSSLLCCCLLTLPVTPSGPVTILNWSFPRKDLSRQAQAFQLAQALREEVADLEAAGCRVIQVSFLFLLHIWCRPAKCMCLDAARWTACTFVGYSRGLQDHGACSNVLL